MPRINNPAHRARVRFNQQRSRKRTCLHGHGRGWKDSPAYKAARLLAEFKEKSSEQRRLNKEAEKLIRDAKAKQLRAMREFCFYCGVKLVRCSPDSPDRFTREHVVPRCQGGKHVVPACYSCNNRKGDQTVEQFRETLSRMSGLRVVFFFERGYT